MNVYGSDSITAYSRLQKCNVSSLGVAITQAGDDALKQRAHGEFHRVPAQCQSGSTPRLSWTLPGGCRGLGSTDMPQPSPRTRSRPRCSRSELRLNGIGLRLRIVLTQFHPQMCGRYTHRYTWQQIVDLYRLTEPLRLLSQMAGVVVALVLTPPLANRAAEQVRNQKANSRGNQCSAQRCFAIVREVRSESCEYEPDYDTGPIDLICEHCPPPGDSPSLSNA